MDESLKEIKIIKILPRDIQHKVEYKGVEIDSGRDLLTKIIQQQKLDLDNIVAGEICRVTRKYGFEVNEEKIKKWAEMCQWLERSATDEDKKAVGVLIYLKHLEGELEKKEQRICDLCDEIEKLRDKLMEYEGGEE